MLSFSSYYVPVPKLERVCANPVENLVVERADCRVSDRKLWTRKIRPLGS